MRISPKINEKPADSKNINPPKATLISVKTSHKFIAAGFSGSSSLGRVGNWLRQR